MDPPLAGYDFGTLNSSALPSVSSCFWPKPAPARWARQSWLNAERTGAFLWNMAIWHLRNTVNRSSMAVAPDVDELELAGAEKAYAVDVPAPRVAASPAHSECEHLSTTRLPGRSPVSWVDVMFARVVHIHVNDDVITGDGNIDIARIRPIARLGSYGYTVVDTVFEMRSPEAGNNELAGLEGSPASADPQRSSR